MLLRLTTIALSLLALIVLGGAGAVRAADDAPTVMFLLDGSGSMWGPFGNERRSKFEIGRETLAQTLERVRPDARMGLSSFGHRRRGYCGDVEVIVPPDANNLEKITTPLPKLNANGMGPVALGLRETAKAIGTAVPATIVLIHDDVDNCSPDTCVAAAEIAKTNPNLAIYSIGLGIGPQKLQQMSCVANATHGRAYDAQDTAGLNSALDEILKLANLEPNAPPATAQEQASKKEQAAAPSPAAPPGLYLTAGLGPDSATLESPVCWRITKAGPDGEVIRETRAAALVEKLPPGAYEVEARLGLANAHQSVDVSADAPTSVRLNLNAGVLKMLARAAKTAQPLPTPVFTVTPVDGGDGKKSAAPLWIGRETQPEIVLPAGDYKVSAEDGLARQEQTVKIAPATGTTFDAMLATGRLELTAARGNGSDPADVSAPRRDLHRLRGRSGLSARAPRGDAVGSPLPHVHATGRHLLRDGAHGRLGVEGAARPRSRRCGEEDVRLQPCTLETLGQNRRRTLARRPAAHLHGLPSRRRAARGRAHAGEGARSRALRGALPRRGRTRRHERARRRRGHADGGAGAEDRC